MAKKNGHAKPESRQQKGIISFSPENIPKSTLLYGNRVL